MSRNIFQPRRNVKPYEYPELMAFKDAIRASYWIHTEFNMTGDIQNYHVDCTPHEKNVVTRAMLAIGQIEVDVKLFWLTIHQYFPKPEFIGIAATFGDSEERHLDAYSFLLEQLGLNSLFENIDQYPVLRKRIDYIRKFLENKNLSREEFALSMILFSLFIEHISLFSQFVIMMSFNKEKNLFVGLSNAIEATSKEEEIHGRFGIELYKILRNEHPEIFTESFNKRFLEIANEAFNTEMELVDWIFDDQDLPFLTRETVKNYIRKRYNNSLSVLGFEPQHLVIEELYKKVEWFDIEVLSTKEIDFFHKRSTEYSKKQHAFTADNLFWE